MPRLRKLRKAFDSVETNAILNALTKEDVHPQYVKLLEKIYTTALSTIQLHTDLD